MAGKKHRKAVRLARERLQDALGNVDAWPDGWLALDFLSPAHGVAIRLRADPHVDVDTAVREADTTCRLESSTGMQLLWFSPQEILDDLDDVLARIGAAVEEAGEFGAGVEWDEEEDEAEEVVGCPMFMQVDLPRVCRYCKNAEGWGF
jgi:very-short-patch-repair endonuclease